MPEPEQQSQYLCKVLHVFYVGAQGQAAVQEAARGGGELVGEEEDGNVALQRACEERVKGGVEVGGVRGVRGERGGGS